MILRESACVEMGFYEYTGLFCKLMYETYTLVTGQRSF